MNYAFVPIVHYIRDRQTAKRSCNKVVNLCVRFEDHGRYAMGMIRYFLW